eukprot:TRINITY_DN8906_c0_g1_i1.p1 TRINITY_DN8906_c0_g1~~TRINITY_DN8906_c0_g1_i1.p1  ORF type:complete len:214 (+),score=97.59 TRINITY_DN8906_c0_g1_i1:68-709(+)
MSSSTLLTQLQSSNDSNLKFNILLPHIRQELATELNLPNAEAIDPDRKLTEYGLDSRIAVSFKNKLSEILSYPIPTVTLFECTTASEVARYISTLELNVSLPLPKSTELRLIENKEGFLWKSGGKKRKTPGGWQRRLFILKDGKTLSYYKNKQEITPRGTISIETITSVESADDITMRPNSFFIATPGRVYFIFSESANDKRDWVNALIRLIA